MSQLKKGEVCSGWGAAEPLQVLRPTDSPVQSLPSGLKQPFLISKLESHVCFFSPSTSWKKFRWETLLQSTTATIAESSGSLATVGPGPPSDRDSGLQLLLISLELHQQVCGLRPDQELCCAGSQEKEVPSEMPTRGAQGLGILLNMFNQF